MTYAIVSDLHCHNWSTFSKTDPDGVNSRLRITLNEWERAAETVRSAGGNMLVCGGDIFHVRGSVDPEVLNPTQDTVRRILDMGIDIRAIPGNHDLKGNDAGKLGSAIQTLSETFSTKATLTVYNEAELVVGDENMAFAPFREKRADLLADIQNLADAVDPAEVDLFIHAGIDGVLPGMPDHGLTDEILGKFGFRHVFAGDYHNHKTLQHNVISIGATTHQSWRDVSSKAGFLLVKNGSVQFFDTHAPKFVDLTGMDEDDIKLACDGNYVRFRGSSMTMKDKDELRDFFVANGALGVSIQVPKAIVNARTGAATSSKTLTLDQSVETYVDSATDIPAHVDRAVLKQRCSAELLKARTVYEDAA